MSEIFREAGDEEASSEADPDDGSRPSVEVVLSAFQAASRRRSSPPERPSAPEPSPEPGPSPRPQPEEETPEPAPETEAEPGRSPAAAIEETITAFRKAERREQEARKQEARSEESRTEAPSSEEKLPEEAPAEEEPSAEEPSTREAPGAAVEAGGGVEEEEIDLDEDLAPAFRRVLTEQAGPEPGASEETSTPEEPSMSEEGGHGGEGEPPPGPSDIEDSSEIEEAPEGAPVPSSSRPEASFLGVTDPSGEQPDADRGSEESLVSVHRLSRPRAREAEAFLLRGEGEEPYRLLRRIRGHSEAEVYLKPVFWRRGEEEQSPVSEHVDGQWREGDREAFGELREKVAAINRRIGTVTEAGDGGEGGVELRVLRFMATRNHEFTPHRTVENCDGFVYPKLTPLLEREAQSRGGELSQVLSMLEERNLLTGEFVMRQHACQNCGCAFLNFEEMCPHCGATDLDADDLVHHFRCAFTGALGEYKKEEGKLVCPKCDRRLKQIGVDYDKPSIVYTCRRCHEEFQDPEVQSTCYRCDHTNPPEQQVERQIKKYEVTALGRETAIYGLSDSLLSILKRESRVLDYATFQLIVDSEAARIERYQRSVCSLLMVRVRGLKQLRKELGERSQEVIEEIATAFDNTLRSSDYLSARDESLYLFLLTETDQDGARRAGERLEGNIEGVLDQNLAHPPELDIAVQPLRPGIDLDNLTERFLASSSQDAAVASER